MHDGAVDVAGLGRELLPAYCAWLFSDSFARIELTNLSFYVRDLTSAIADRWGRATETQTRSLEDRLDGRRNPPIQSPLEPLPSRRRGLDHLHHLRLRGPAPPAGAEGGGPGAPTINCEEPSIRVVLRCRT